MKLPPVLHGFADMPDPPTWLGLAGLLPFFLSAGLAWFGDGVEWAVLALTVYGAVILSFLGGVRWGVALRSDVTDQWVPWAISVLPSLVAWFAVVLGGAAGLMLLVLGFGAQWAVDMRAVKDGELPVWFGRLRTVLSAGAVVSLLIGVLAVE